jgi:hypothetical protein
MVESRRVEQTLIFLHIQKTGGTTLHRIVERHYPPEANYFLDSWQFTLGRLINMSDYDRAKIRMLRGHMVFGMHQYLPNSSTYFTVLRDPVGRVISYYYHVRRDPKHHWHDFVVSKDLDLKAFLESGKDIGMTDFQTRVLAGGRWHDSAYGQCPQEALWVAKRHLRDHFAVVGLVERFDETLLLLKDVFGWQDLFYVRRNVTQKHPRRDGLSSDTLAAIVEANQIDLQLYQYVTTSFERQVRRQGPAFTARVKSFQWLNRLLGPLPYGDQEVWWGSFHWFARKWTRRILLSIIAIQAVSAVAMTRAYTLGG